MNKPFGLRAELQGYPWKDITEEFVTDGITIKIYSGLIEVGYDKQVDEMKARRLAKLYIHSQSLRIGRRLTAVFNHSWTTKAADGSFHSVNVSDTVTASDRVRTNQVTITGKANIVKPQVHDSASFTNDTAMVEKALRYPALEEALEYFTEEVVDDERPLYGVYKSVEKLTHELGKDGRKTLGLLAGKNEKYVSEVMETTNTKRHAVSPARKLLSDEECIERAKLLINAYAASLS